MIDVTRSIIENAFTIYIYIVLATGKSCMSEQHLFLGVGSIFFLSKLQIKMSFWRLCGCSKQPKLWMRESSSLAMIMHRQYQSLWPQPTITPSNSVEIS